MTIATVGSDGIPHAAVVYFISDDSLNFYFLSAEHSQHILDLTTTPKAGATIFPIVANWREIRGLQMQGNIKEVTNETKWVKGWKIFAGKFPDIRGLDIEIIKNKLYVFTPNWIRLVDNRNKFGFKQEWSDEKLDELKKR